MAKPGIKETEKNEIITKITGVFKVDGEKLLVDISEDNSDEFINLLDKFNKYDGDFVEVKICKKEVIEE